MVSRITARRLLAGALVLCSGVRPCETVAAPTWRSHGVCPPEVSVPRRWPEDSVRSEDDVLAVINRYRERGVTCRATRTRQRPVRPLEEDDALREAARRHSAYMAQRGAFDHTLAGCAFSTWIDAAGYKWRSVGENIAMRRGTRASTAEAVVGQWLASREGHCEALMDPHWRAAGVGHARNGTRQLWTVDFGDR
jgi:uncharacterized protein YkwD